MSPIHCSPADSVLLHHDVKSKLSVGMHRGAFAFTDEPVNLPPQKVKTERGGTYQEQEKGRNICYHQCWRDHC